MNEELKKYLFQRPYKDDESCQVFRDWWIKLEDNKGERAELRRAASIQEVIFIPAYHRLLHSLQNKNYSVNRQALAAVAGLASHVRENQDTGSMAKQMATAKSSGQNARVSGLRFRRILAIKEKELDDLYPVMYRIIKMLEKNINIVDMANSVYYWNENTKKQWAYDYYATAPKEL